MGIQKTKMDKNVNSLFHSTPLLFTRRPKFTAWKQKCPKQQRNLYTFSRRRLLDQQQEVLETVGQEYCYPATEAKI